MSPGSLLTAVGYLTGGLVLYLAARASRQATEKVAWVVLAGLAGGVVGARLAEWLLGHTATLAQNPGLLFDLRQGGRALLGGIAGGWGAVVIAKRLLGLHGSTGDLFAVALPAGEALGRLGCFYNGCCYGAPVATGSFAAGFAVFQHGAWRHPAQLYAAVAAATLFGFLWALRGLLPQPGDLFRLYLALFGISRVGIEFYRERPAGWAGLSLAQWVALGLAAYGAAGLVRSFRQAAPRAPERVGERI